MTGPAVVQDDDPVSAYKKKYGAASPSADDPVAAYKAKYGAGGNQKLHDEFAVGNLARRMESENATDAVENEPSYAQKALGGVASLARDIPGAEALQAGARSVVRRQPYSEARADIRSAEDAAPTAVRVGNRLIGGTVAAMALPIKSPTASGAVYGAASGALQSDPNAGLGDRARDAAIGGVTGAITGKLADAGSNLVRSIAAKPLDQQAAKQAALKSMMARKNYGMADVEAWANGGTSPAVKAALSDPDVRPYVDVVRSSRTAGGLDDAGVLREAYKLMGERQASVGSRIANSDDFKAGSQLEQKDLTAAKGMLKRAGATVMPSFPRAVEDHAAISALEDARTTGSKMASLANKGKQVGDKKLLKTGASALTGAAENMTPMEAEAGLNGLLGRTKDVTGASVNPVTGFGLVPSMYRAGKATPFIQQLEEQMGGAPIPVDILRALVASQGHPTP